MGGAAKVFKIYDGFCYGMGHAIVGIGLAYLIVGGVDKLKPYIPVSHKPIQQQQQREDAQTQPLFLMADAAAQKYGIETALFRALVTQESGWNPEALSKAGASGLTQLMPATAKEECKLFSGDIFDPAKNLDCGAFYFAKQMRRFDFNVELALAAYNSGPERVAKLGRVPKIPETEDYVTRIMANWQPSGR